MASFKTDKALIKYLRSMFLPEELDQMRLLDGHSTACVGVWYDDEHDCWRLLYDKRRVIETLMDRDGMGGLEAHEFFDFNIAGGLPPDGPRIIHLFSP